MRAPLRRSLQPARLRGLGQRQLDGEPVQHRGRRGRAAGGTGGVVLGGGDAVVEMAGRHRGLGDLADAVGELAEPVRRRGTGRCGLQVPLHQRDDRPPVGGDGALQAAGCSSS